MRRAQTYVVALTAVILAGCALAPAPTRDDVLKKALPEKTEIPPAWKAAGGAEQVTNNWLKSLNDPMLEAIVAEAIANNLDLRQAAERVRAAQQVVIVVGAQLQPLVGATLGARTLHDEDHDGTNQSTLAYAGVGWELDVWGKLRSQRAATQAGYEATALDYASARQSLAAIVARTWYLAIEIRQLLALAEQSVTIYGDLLKLVTTRRAAGKDSDLNVVDMQANVDSAQGSVEAARESYGDIRRALELLLGRYPAAEIGVADAFPQLLASPETGVPATLLERRPDVVSAEQAVLAAFRNTEAARLALLPDFSISLVGGRLGDSVMSLLRLNPWLATAAIGVSIPIYEGGALRAQAQIATAKQAEMVARYGNTVLRSFREVESALANEQLLRKRVAQNESTVRNRTEAVRIATVQYLAGSKDLLWVSNLQNNQLAAESELIKLHGLRHLNRISLSLALGGSFDTQPAAALQPVD